MTKTLVKRLWLQMFPGHDKRHGTRTGTLTAPGRTGHEPLGPTWLPQPVLAPHAQMGLPSKGLAVPQYFLHVRYGGVGMRQMEHGDSSALAQHPHPLLPCPICPAPQLLQLLCFSPKSSHQSGPAMEQLLKGNP